MSFANPDPMLPRANYTLSIASQRRTEVVEMVRQALTGQEWALVNVSGDESTLSFSAPPRIMEKIREALRVAVL